MCLVQLLTKKTQAGDKARFVQNPARGVKSDRLVFDLLGTSSLYGRAREGGIDQPNGQQQVSII